jgi:hypothetical protein
MTVPAAVEMIRATAPERSRFAKQFWQKRTAHYGKIGAGQAKGVQGEIGIQTCSSSSMGRALLVCRRPLV